MPLELAVSNKLMSRIGMGVDFVGVLAVLHSGLCCEEHRRGEGGRSQ
jgi:hypothetical protein